MSKVLEKNIFEFGFMAGQRVADFGAGAGHYTLGLGKTLGKGSTIIALDIEEGALSRLKKEAELEGLDNIEVLLGDIEKEGGSNLRDNSCDGVVFATTLCHLKEREKSAREAYRITKHGGRAVLVEWQEGTAFHNAEKKGDRVVAPELAEKIFTKAGFKLERGFHAGEEHYGMIFRK